MKVRFDSLNRFEVPKFYVCNPGSVYNDGVLSKVVGCLSDTTDEEIVMNFNAKSELNLRAYRINREDSDENEYVIKLYKSLQNRRMIFVDGVGYFTITNVQDGYSDGVHYKDIRASSCETEIENKMLTYIEDGTYQFTELLETVVAPIPLWTIGDIDDAIAEKYRTFEDVSSELNSLAFMLDNMQNAYECIFVFDCINRVIHVYDQNNYAVQTQVHITKDDVINSIDISEDSDDLYTAISVLGDNDLNIVPINPLGTNVIYNFDYYLSWMSPSLRARVESWQELMSFSAEEYYNSNLDYYTILSEISSLELYMEMLNTQITMYQRCRENIVAESSTDSVDSYNAVITSNEGIAITIQDEISDTLSEIDTLITNADAEYESCKLLLNSLSDDLALRYEIVTNIRESVAMASYFTPSEYNELSSYIFEGTYSDEYITVTDSMTYSEKFQQMKVLYDRAVSQLERVSQPTQEFSLDVENFLFVKEFEVWSEQLETGCLINVELDTDDVAMLFLSNITVNYDDKSLTMTFGNRFNKFDPKALFDNALGNIKKSANTLEYIKELLCPVKNGEFNAMKEALQTSRTLTMNAALASTNEEIVIDESGYTGRKLLESGEFDPRQVKITSKYIVFTDDAWDTCKVALGELILGDDETVYGINAQAIAGDIIIGNSIRILDREGNDLFTVVDDKISASVSGYNERLMTVEGTADQLTIDFAAFDTDTKQITTTNGFKFGSDGLTIYEEDSELQTRIDADGMDITRDDETVLAVNSEGVEAMNLTAQQFLILGTNCRFEDYATEADANRTGCFYIGGV